MDHNGYRSEISRRLVTGKYIGLSIVFNIIEENGKLHYQVGNHKLELQAHTEVAFTTKTPNGIIFLVDEQGDPKGCKLYHSTEGILHCKYHKKDRGFH